MAQLAIACLCGTADQTVATRPSPPDGLVLCHCTTCRRTTGELFTSYRPIRAPARLAGLVAYAPSSPAVPAAAATRYFCGTCGCHVFRARAGGEGWEVATGTVVSGEEEGEAGAAESGDGDGDAAGLVRHAHVDDTRDGGAAVWLAGTGWRRSATGMDSAVRDGRVIPTPPPPPPPGPEGDAEPRLRAHCDCRRIQLLLARPPSADAIHSPFPDLLLPYHSTSPSAVANASSAAWWHRPGRRYLAGTCACRSCRLGSGFEVQAWAFVPRAQIAIFVPSSAPSSPSSSLPSSEEQATPTPKPPASADTLSTITTATNQQGTFHPLPIPVPPTSTSTSTSTATPTTTTTPLASFPSSPGVSRAFCPRCGATVFWQSTERPELVDVSVGLLCAAGGDGARAEGWLGWWGQRVSFAEEVRRGRTGPAAERAAALVSRLEAGLRLWDDAAGGDGGALRW